MHYQTLSCTRRLLLLTVCVRANAHTHVSSWHVCQAMSCCEKPSETNISSVLRRLLCLYGQVRLCRSRTALEHDFPVRDSRQQAESRARHHHDPSLTWAPCLYTCQLNAYLPCRQVADFKPRNRPMEHPTTREFDSRMGLTAPGYLIVSLMISGYNCLCHNESC